VLGETIDIGLGNMIDKLGRELGLRFPCGPEIERIAAKGRNYIELPYSVKGMDVSFSGITTAALALAKKHPIEDVMYSVQETCFGMVCEVTERAMAHTDSKELLIGGGVAQNKRLQEMAALMTQDRGARSFIPPNEFLRDNGAMIAWTGMLMHEHGTRTSIEDSAVDQRWRTDEVEVTWR
jgi:glycoprotease/Kae1 family metallohydrolase